ncbi:hypothetical protein NPIL_378351 [Nephila pilipes]|uniref:Uncharacterized protein n=1 Tax=Nephila pilipes TaxID=299642 RepID=A0A8X6NZ74_NEPPI|nr:hypothetical protein NPIL_378351 [Nephila pilipes]
MGELPLKVSQTDKIFQKPALEKPVEIYSEKHSSCEASFSEFSLSDFPKFSETIENLTNDVVENGFDSTQEKKKQGFPEIDLRALQRRDRTMTFNIIKCCWLTARSTNGRLEKVPDIAATTESQEDLFATWDSID